MKVCVFGSYKDIGPAMRRETVRLGRLLAGKGITVVTGGFGGVMEDASRGAKEAGGPTIGVTFYKRGKASKRRANPYLDREIKTYNIFRRIEKMLECDGFVAMPGGTGTLLELAAVIEHLNKGLMPPKPFVAIGDWWKNTTGALEGEPVLNEAVTKILKISNCSKLVRFVKNADEAVAILLRYIG